MQDVFDSAVLIEAYFQNSPTLSIYKANTLLIDAIERRLAIIGEALWKADKLDKTLVVSNKRRIIALRHILIHDYDLIEDEAIWLICQKNIPVLKDEVQLILNNNQTVI